MDTGFVTVITVILPSGVQQILPGFADPLVQFFLRQGERSDVNDCLDFACPEDGDQLFVPIFCAVINRESCVILFGRYRYVEGREEPEWRKNQISMFDNQDVAQNV